jgi:hypothetical protein
MNCNTGRIAYRIAIIFMQDELSGAMTSRQEKLSGKIN